MPQGDLPSSSPARRQVYVNKSGPPAAAALETGSGLGEAAATGGSSAARSPASGQGALGLRAARHRLPREHLRATPAPPARPRCDRPGPPPGVGGSESGKHGASPPPCSVPARGRHRRRRALCLCGPSGDVGAGVEPSPRPGKGKSKACGGGC